MNGGLILRAQEQSGLAGVMAHEYRTSRHAPGPGTSPRARSCRSLRLNIAIPLTYLKFSCDAEGEADFSGLQYMCKAAYDPDAFISCDLPLEVLHSGNDLVCS